MNVTAVGVDLAKIVLQAHGVDGRGKVTMRKQLKRGEVLNYFANLPPCLIGMEACSSAHHWARKLMEYGHTVKLMAPQFVKPYVKTNKNDARDAEAICEAVTRHGLAARETAIGARNNDFRSSGYRRLPVLRHRLRGELRGGVGGPGAQPDQSLYRVGRKGWPAHPVRH
jgi:transposase